jgi:hypothetical protein
MDGTFDEAGSPPLRNGTVGPVSTCSRSRGWTPYAFDIAAARSVLAEGSLEVAASLGVPEHADISTAEPEGGRGTADEIP